VVTEIVPGGLQLLTPACLPYAALSPAAAAAATASPPAAPATVVPDPFKPHKLQLPDLQALSSGQESLQALAQLGSQGRLAAVAQLMEQQLSLVSASSHTDAATFLFSQRLSKTGSLLLPHAYLSITIQ
jgi:hypothetical protein